MPLPTATDKALRRLPLSEFGEFTHPGDTGIHQYGWRNVFKELLRRYYELERRCSDGSTD